MSKFLDKAEEIKTRLEAVDGLAGMRVIVDRQKDLRSDFQKAMGKVRGGVIVIFWDGFSRPDGDENLVRSSYVITVFSKPVIKNDVKADDVVDLIDEHLQYWSGDAKHCVEKASVTGARLVRNPKFLIYEIKIEIPLL